MGLLSFLAPEHTTPAGSRTYSLAELRTALVNGDPWLVELLARGTQTASGVWVTPETSLRIAAVYRAVTLIARHIAMLPLILYRRGEGNTNKQAHDHPLFSLLHDSPNDWQTSFEWREMMIGHVLLQGNAYSEIFWNRDGSIAQLVPMNPQRTRPFRRDDGSIWYEFRPLRGTNRYIAADEMFHVKGHSNDGLTGLAPIALMREAIGMGMSAEEYQARFFSNDATPPIALVLPPNAKAMDDEAKKRMKQSWQEAHSGAPNTHKVAVLEGGLDIKTIGVNNKDAEFLGLRKFTISEIARIFGVPLHMLGDLDRATFSNIEQQSREYIRDCLGPWAKNIEDAIAFRLMSAKMRSSYFAKFKFNALLRGDMQARSVFYHEAILDGWMNRNEIRQEEDLDPAGPALNVYLQPLNEAPAGGEEKPPEPAAKPGNPPAPAAEDEENERKGAMLTELRHLVRDRAERLVRKEVTALRRLAQKSKTAAELVQQIDAFYLSFEADPDYIQHSRRELAQVLGAGDVAGVETCATAWERERVDQVVAHEMERWEPRQSKEERSCQQ